ncbi:superfamily II helicase [Cenarchaeum symbiosum A]|uniref:Superfamily II helicase n=1 Tax=Cenarchaeum symbiosum (strain A) TaxID=414004 RepID=A0RWM8_CENSY|nr:superfamily II helicase [Cenarchaeum symbiosum A]
MDETNEDVLNVDIVDIVDIIPQSVRNSAGGRENFQIINYKPGLKVGYGVDLEYIMENSDSEFLFRAKKFGIYGMFCERCEKMHLHVPTKYDLPDDEDMLKGQKRTIVNKCEQCVHDTIHQIDWVIKFNDDNSLSTLQYNIMKKPLSFSNYENKNINDEQMRVHEKIWGWKLFESDNVITVIGKNGYPEKKIEIGALLLFSDIIDSVDSYSKILKNMHTIYNLDGSDTELTIMNIYANMIWSCRAFTIDSIPYIVISYNEYHNMITIGALCMRNEKINDKQRFSRDFDNNIKWNLLGTNVEYVVDDGNTTKTHVYDGASWNPKKRIQVLFENPRKIIQIKLHSYINREQIKKMLKKCAANVDTPTYWNETYSYTEPEIFNGGGLPSNEINDIIHHIEYLYPGSGLTSTEKDRIKHVFKNAERRNHTFGLLHMVSTLRGFPLKGSLDEKMKIEMTEILKSNVDELFYNVEVDNCNRVTLAMYHWINEDTKDNIKNITGFQNDEITLMSSRGYLCNRLVTIAESMNRYDLVEELNALDVRISYGIKKELLPFVNINNMTRKRAMLLYSMGMTTLDSLRNISEEELAEIKGIGQKCAKSIKAYLQSDI